MIRRYRSLEATSKKIEGLVRGGSLSQRDALSMYEGLFLNGYVATEKFIEELFLGLLIKDRGCESERDDVLPRLEVRSHGMARELIIGPEKNYVDWVPYPRTVERSKIFFRGGRPFSDLAQPHKDALHRSHIIRNCIAHRSQHSIEQFEKHVIGNATLPPNERTPAGYLRGIFRVAPTQTRFSNLLGQLSIFSRNLAR